MTTSKASWYGELLRAGLDTKILSDTAILSHATPAVLISALPRDVLANVFEAALTTGTMSPEAVVRIATPEMLAEHVPPAVIWACIASAADRAGIPAAKPAEDEAPTRELLRRAVTSGMANGAISAADLIRYIDARVLAHSLSDELTQKLLEAGLAAGKMNPELIVDTLGAAGITAYAPTHIVWACIAAAADPGGAASGMTRAAGKPALEFVAEEEIASVLVDLDDSSVLKPMIVEAKEASAKPSKNVVRRGQS